VSDSERLAVEEMIRSGPDLASMAPPELRKTYDRMMAEVTKPAPDIAFGAVTANGVSGEIGRAPASRADRTILYFHGGGYVIGSLPSHRGMVSALGQSAGARTLAVDYRLAPEHPYPAAIDDAVAAYRWLLESGAAPSSIALAGDSAGGGLAIACLLRARDEGLPMPAALSLFSPFADLSASSPTVQEKAVEDVLVSPAIIHGMAAAYLGGRDAKDPYASPIYGDLRGLPPMFIQVGSAECLLDDSLRLARTAGAAGVAVELKIWPKLPHVWQLFASLLEEGRQSLTEAGAFLARHFS
jgi:acetyl esterase/lipase